MFGFPWNLIAYGVMAIAIAGFAYTAWSGFKSSIAAPYVAAQIKADQAHLDKADQNARAADAERDNAKSDTLACQAASARQSAEVTRLGNVAAANLAAAREARAQAQREASAAAPRIADLQAKAAAAPKLMACEEELSRAKDVLRESLRARRQPAVAPK